MVHSTTSEQDYLKALLKLSKNGRAIHSADVADVVGVSRASVSKAMELLKESKYITKEKYGPIALTPLGTQAAGAVKKCNELIKTFLTDILGVNDNVTKYDACRMEHTISSETAEKLEKYLKSREVE